MIKICLCLFLLILGGCGRDGTLSVNNTQTDRLKIAFLSKFNQSNAEIEKAFYSELKENGYTDRNVIFLSERISGDEQTDTERIKNIVIEEVDLLVVSDGEIMETVEQQLSKSEIPVLYCDDEIKTEQPFSGIIIRADLMSQLAILKQEINLQTMAVYFEEEHFETFEELRKEAEKLSIAVYDYHEEKSEEIVYDLVYLLDQPAEEWENELPVLSSVSDSDFCFEADATAVGKQLGKMATQLLKGEKKLSELTPEMADKFNLECEILK